MYKVDVWMSIILHGAGSRKFLRRLAPARKGADNGGYLHSVAAVLSGWPNTTSIRGLYRLEIVVNETVCKVVAVEVVETNYSGVAPSLAGARGGG